MIDWEDICQRCGLCCFEKKIDERGRIVTTPVPCRHLDIVTRECRVYHKRFDVGEGCVKLTPEVIAEADWLPDTCAYRLNSGAGLEVNQVQRLLPRSESVKICKTRKTSAFD